MTFEAATDFAARTLRSWNCWIVLQPTGNFYLTDRKADAAPGELVVAVCRRGTAVVESILPRAWRAA
jgi:hypothetical protein